MNSKHIEMLLENYSHEKYSKFEALLKSRGFRFLGSGAFRNTYGRGNIVVKVPKNYDGLVDCLVERRAYRTYQNSVTPEGYQLAPCRLLPNGCLMMALVQVDIDFFQKPQWARRIDGYQVGKYKQRIVAYDYALNMDNSWDWETEWETDKHRRNYRNNSLQRQNDDL